MSDDRRKLIDMPHGELAMHAHEMQGAVLKYLGAWTDLMCRMRALADWPGPDTRETAEAMRAFAQETLEIPPEQAADELYEYCREESRNGPPATGAN